MHDRNTMHDDMSEFDAICVSNAMPDSVPEQNALHDVISNDDVASIDMPSGTMHDAEPPMLPRPRMPRSQRAKIFIPFDPLKGYQEALREKEREIEATFDHSATTQDSED